MGKFQTGLLLIVIMAISRPLGAQQWSLDKCLEYAQLHNQELLAKEQHTIAAEWESKSARAQLLPEITGKAGTDHYWAIPVQVFPGELVGQPQGTYVPVKLGTPWMGNIGVEASLKLIDPQTWQEVKLAVLQKQMAEGNWRSLKRTMFKNVRMAYYQSQLQMENQDIAEERYRRYQEMHELISDKFEKGLTDKITLNQSLSILESLKEAWSKTAAAARNAMLDLKFWMGFPLGDSLSIDGNIVWASADTSAFNPEDLPEYENEKLKVSLARQQYKSAQSGGYPSLSLQSGYSRLGFGQSLDFINHSEWFASGYVGLQLNVPLLSLSKMFYEPRKQSTMTRSAELQFAHYKNAQRKHYMEEETGFQQSLNSVKTQEERLKLAQENEALSFKKIEKGIINMIELKQVQQDLDEARQELNNARLNLAQHAVELYYLQNNEK